MQQPYTPGSTLSASYFSSESVSERFASERVENYAYGNGYIYNGYIQNGIPNGEGDLVQASNSKLVKRGTFRNGHLISGTYYSPSGLIQQGTFNENGNLHGAGMIKLISGGYLKGTWDDGKPKGIFDVFLGIGRVPMKYSFGGDDRSTKFVIVLHSEFIFFDDKYLLQPGDNILLYYNGNIFLGNTDSHNNPTLGILYYLENGKYHTMYIGDARHYDGFDINMDFQEDAEFKNVIVTV